MKFLPHSGEERAEGSNRQEVWCWCLFMKMNIMINGVGFLVQVGILWVVEGCACHSDCKHLY